jgi:hypothetical protein
MPTVFVDAEVVERGRPIWSTFAERAFAVRLL